MLSKLPKLAIFGAGIILGVPLGLWLLQRIPTNSAPIAVAYALGLAGMLIFIILLWRDSKQ